MAKGRSQKPEIWLRQNDMNVWEQYKASRAITVKLDELGLVGLWIKAIPNSAFEPATITDIDKEKDDQLKGQAYIKLWVLDWNLPGRDGNKLPLPKDSDEWASVMPLEVQMLLVREITKVDKERLEVPLANATPSSPPPAATDKGQSG